LVEDGGAETVQTLLAAARSLQLLVTSRTALELVSERRFEVLPLPVPKQGAGCWVSGVEKQDARIEAPLSPGAQRPIPGLRSAHSDTRHPTPGTLLSIPSIALFVDRAQAVRPDFQLGSHNADAVMALCVRLEGIPLAIELAAARTQLLSPSQMLAQLEDRFAFLVSRRRDIPSRHRTLRATLEWSARLLSPELHRRLARLSVFRGGWTIETATEVCAESLDILESLEVLCNSSLTVAEETPEGGIRFRMLETIREFAAEILETSDEAEQIRTRHANWCLRLVNSAHKASTGPDQQMWLDRLELEHDNLRAALTWRLKCPLDSEDRDPLPALTLLRLCAVLPNFWWTRGYLDEGRAWCAAALDRAGAASRTSDRGDVLSGAGVLALRQGDYAAARAYFEECLSIRRELGHAQGISYALNNLGMLACDEGDYKAAHTYYAESLSIKRELGDQKAVAGTLNNMGMVAQSLGDFAAAETQYREALHINRELGNRAFEANNLNNMGIAAELQGDLSTARGYYEESLPIRQALGDRWGIAYSLYCLGHLDCLLKNYRSAEDHLQESLTIRKEVGHRPGIAQSLSALAELAVALSMASEDEQAVWLPTEADTIDMLVRHAVPLWSAASALRHEIGDRLSTWEQEALDRKIAAVRERIGPADFDAAWSAGQAMSMDQAIASAQSTRRKLVD
jgi:predicted ATPase